MNIVSKLLTPEVRTSLKALALALIGAVTEYLIGVIDALGSAT